ncbi:MAG TPA: SPOR domain-containing protein [Vicinamibacterales bacterium]|nr:SPOR domain-containing protein [Vicinamibacterales bacterium]
MSDEEFREFYLDGKSLAFLVISGIGVAVVVFLCGVLVGRGVRAPRAAETADLAAAALGDSLGAESSLDTGSSSADGTSHVPGREPDRSDRFGGTPAAETIPTPPPEPVIPEPAASPAPRAPAPAPASVAAKPPPPATPPRDAAARKWVVQVASGANRASAESFAGRLKSKGYDAFVSSPEGGGQYRVRVGPFDKKSDADAVAGRLKKEGKYKDLWVTH